MAGGIGWMSLGTTIKSLPRTRIAPALFAVPESPKASSKCELNENKSNLHRGQVSGI
jgi:hypothetical protein